MAEGYSLEKGEVFAIDKGFDKVTVGLGWDIQKEAGGKDYDLDAVAIMVNKHGKGIGPVYFRNKSNVNNSIRLLGDNRTGEGEGDDEQL